MTPLHSDGSSINRQVLETPLYRKIETPKITPKSQSDEAYFATSQISIHALISKMNFLHKKARQELRYFATESLIPWSI